MSDNRKYPRIGRQVPHPGNISARCRCGEIGKLKVDIQVSYMRGDDETVWSCDEHRKDVEFLTADWGMRQ